MNLRALLLITLLSVLLRWEVAAQFPSTPTQTFYVCNAPNEQKGVQAFADGADGSYVYWLDKRGGTAVGTAIYGQHLSAAGVAQWPANGKLVQSTRGHEIWAMQAVPWRGGILMAWVQGPFGIGGDTVLAQFYNAAGVAQWARPTVVAHRNLPTGVIYVLESGLNVLPNDSGATITHSMAVTGGAALFTYNRVSATGRRRWPNLQQQVSLPYSTYYHTLGDGGNGFYVVGGSGGLGSALYAQHYNLQGVSWSTGINLSETGADGRGNGQWRLVRDPAGNLYVVWGSNSGDVYVTKITPQGALGWSAPGYRLACTTSSRQELPHALWLNNALWIVWNDTRMPASNYYQYAQKLNAAGTLAWSPGGVLLNSLPTYYVDPKLTPADNGAVMAFYNTTQPNGFRAQKLLPTGRVGWTANGAAINTTPADAPSYQDFEPVTLVNGSVCVYWATGLGQICGAKVYPAGVLGREDEAPETAGFAVYPNPATHDLRLLGPRGEMPVVLYLFDGQGRRVREGRATDHLSVAGLPPGVYAVRASYADHVLTRRVVVGSE